MPIGKPLATTSILVVLVVGYMLSQGGELEIFVEVMVATFVIIIGSIQQMHKTCVSIWVTTSNWTWERKKSKASCML